VSYFVDDIGAAVAEYNTSAQMCSQEILVGFEHTTLQMVGMRSATISTGPADGRLVEMYKKITMGIFVENICCIFLVKKRANRHSTQVFSINLCLLYLRTVISILKLFLIWKYPFCR